MQIRLLIDDIVRQTTLLIGHLSTAAGLREPLSHIADQVFLELSRELDAQGVRLKVAADMFGMTLRSYQLKVRRLSEQCDRRGASLWCAIHDRLKEATASRDELIHRFGRHDPKKVAATLCDMVESGVAYSSGRGPKAVYGVIAARGSEASRAADQGEMLKERLWYLVASGSPRSELAARLQLDDVAAVDRAVDELIEEGHLELAASGALAARRFEVAVGAARGWETAVGDHFRAVATAVVAKVARRGSERDDRIGGATLTFRVHPDHPDADEVYRLLATTRERADALWRRVALHNEQYPPPAASQRVTFYFGQNVVGDETAQPLDASAATGTERATETGTRRKTA